MWTSILQLHQTTISPIIIETLKKAHFAGEGSRLERENEPFIPPYYYRNRYTNNLLPCEPCR
jgi:hypothetical protein